MDADTPSTSPDLCISSYMKESFYITTTLPYVNADPHIGFALEIVQADAIARYQKLLGKEVFLNTGTDEHAIKIYRNAEKEGIPFMEYVDRHVARFQELMTTLNIWKDHTFIRTTDEHHIASAQEFWKRCEANGNIYKKNYQIKYCVGCELEKTDSDLEDGKCPIHPTYDIEMIDEENYFFRFSKYQKPLLDLYDRYPDFVVPWHRQKEIRAFVERGLEDFSISRLKEKMPWGVPVPGDEAHVMYVWFDALVNYISTLGWPDFAPPTGGSTPGSPAVALAKTGKPEDEKRFEHFWGSKEEPRAIQICGKDNLRQQTAMWQAMLLSANLPTSRQVFIHGFITAEGQKMSKSVGNVIDPFQVIEKYGADAVRFYLLGAVPSAEDGDWSEERFREFYTAHLANGVGNLTSRILTMMEKYGGLVTSNQGPVTSIFDCGLFWEQYDAYMKSYQFDEVIRLVMKQAADVDAVITQQKPWEKAKNGEDISGLLYQLAEGLRHIALALLPIIPQSAEKILRQLGIDLNGLERLEVERQLGRLGRGVKVEKGEMLFPRL